MQISFAMRVVFIVGTTNRFQICLIYTYVPLFQLLFKLMKMATIVRMRMKDKGDGDQAPVPLSIFRSNSKFDENSKHFCDWSGIYPKLERSEFLSNFEFDRNMLSGTRARTKLLLTDLMTKRITKNYCQTLQPNLQTHDNVDYLRRWSSIW